MEPTGNTTAPICPITGGISRVYARRGDAVYLRDPGSDIIFLAERPRLEDMAAFVDAEYESGVYRDYVDARELKLATMKRRLPRIRQHARGARLLDVGCGAGFFLEAALEAGFEPTGIELSPVAIALAQPTVQRRIICGDVNTLLANDESQFDVVTAFDIIEHTFDPPSFLDDVGRVLAPGGLLVISTPDTGHWLRPVMRSHWPMLQPDQHTFLFSRSAMRALLLARGYEPLRFEAGHKVLTLDYLFGQLRQTNPTLARFLDHAKKILPASLRHREIGVNIGEMFLCARKLSGGDQARPAVGEGSTVETVAASSKRAQRP
jgi:2-polyprenyl-3-methyl-5-hydroxy-6-metoxy-1,4-benzoquinol methylase